MKQFIGKPHLAIHDLKIEKLPKTGWYHQTYLDMVEMDFIFQRLSNMSASAEFIILKRRNSCVD